jgi:hypothetical protein
MISIFLAEAKFALARLPGPLIAHLIDYLPCHPIPRPTGC